MASSDLPPDASFDEIAAAIGVDAPRLEPGQLLGTELGNAQLYWPGFPPDSDGNFARQNSIRRVAA